jgi:hypothetical protein
MLIKTQRLILKSDDNDMAQYLSGRVSEDWAYYAANQLDPDIENVPEGLVWTISGHLYTDKQIRDTMKSIKVMHSQIVAMQYSNLISETSANSLKDTLNKILEPLR